VRGGGGAGGGGETSERRGGTVGVERECKGGEVGGGGEGKGVGEGRLRAAPLLPCLVAFFFPPFFPSLLLHLSLVVLGGGRGERRGQDPSPTTHN
jgi:hypothetical protein